MRVCHFVGVHVTCRAAELGRISKLGELSELLLDSHLIYLELLAQAGR